MTETILNTTDICILPTRGELYPEDFPLYKKEFVEFRDMTSVEEDILTNKVLLKKGVAFNKIMKNVLVDKNIDVERMTIVDRRALLIRLRSNSYGPEYRFNVRCPECGTRKDMTVNLMELYSSSLEKVKMIEQTLKDFSDYNLARVSYNTFEFTTKKSGRRIGFRIGDGRDEYEIFKEEEKKKRMAKESDVFSEGVVLSTLKRFIVSIDGNRDRSILEKEIRALHSRDNYDLRILYHELSCEFDLVAKFVCENDECGYEENIEVPITSGFFRPVE